MLVVSYRKVHTEAEEKNLVVGQLHACTVSGLRLNIYKINIGSLQRE